MNTKEYVNRVREKFDAQEKEINIYFNTLSQKQEKKLSAEKKSLISIHEEAQKYTVIFYAEGNHIEKLVSEGKYDEQTRKEKLQTNADTFSANIQILEQKLDELQKSIQNFLQTATAYVH